MRISDWSSDVCSSDLRCLADIAFEYIAPRNQCEIPRSFEQTLRTAFEIDPPGDDALDSLTDPGRLEMLAELAGQPLPDSRQFALTQALQRAASHPEFTPFAIGQLLFNQPLAPCRQTRPYLTPETGIAHDAARFFHQLPIEPGRRLLRRQLGDRRRRDRKSTRLNSSH